LATDADDDDDDDADLLEAVADRREAKQIAERRQEATSIIMTVSFL
jgi:hypothetical protein